MRLVLLAAAGLLTLSACGGGGSVTPAAPVASQTAEGATSTPETESSTAAPVKLPPISASDLRKQLLTIDDLAPGYSADKLTADDSSEKGTHTFCNYKATPARTMVSQTFTKDQGLASSILQVGIRRYASADIAAKQMDLLKQTMQTCDGETLDGTKVEYSLISAPQLGDSRIGIKIAYDQGVNTEYFILLGSDLIQAAMGGTSLSDITISQLNDLAQKQVEKVRAAS